MYEIYLAGAGWPYDHAQRPHHYDRSVFVRRVGAQKAVPLHGGLFDVLDPQVFACVNKVIPHIYAEIEV